jgi:type IV pilus assembly protein PilX
MKNHFNPRKESQKGATLIVAILFLLVITVLGISSWQMSSGEEKMAGFSRDRQLAYEAAEAALRDAEYDIKGQCAPSSVCNKRTPAIDKELGFPARVTNVAAPVACQPDGLCSVPKDDARNVGIVPLAVLRCGTYGPSTSCTNGQSISYGQYTRAAGGSSSYMPNSTGLAAQRLAFAPRYTIQAACLGQNKGDGSCMDRSLYYIITAIGFGQRPNTEVVLQTYYQPDR